MHMRSKPTLVLDGRKAYDSGIGTYIRNLIPYLQHDFELKLIGSQSLLQKFDCKIIQTSSKAYSLSDFYLPSYLAGKTDIFWTPHFNFPLYPPRARLKVATIHDLYHKAAWNILSVKQKLIYKIFLKNLSLQADLIFTVSDFTSKEIDRYYPEMTNRVQVNHAGVDLGVFTPAMTSLDPVIKSKYQIPDSYLLFVGNLKPNKNLVTLLKAYQQWSSQNSKSDIKIVVAGKRDGFRIKDNEALHYISSNGLENKVVFTGFVEEAHLPLLYQHALLFIFPSLYEGFGLPPLEAMACGCPVACSAGASIPEICREHVFYFNGYDFSSLSMLMTKLLSSPEMLTKKADTARQWVTRYDWSRSAEKHIKTLMEGLKSVS